MRHNERLCIGDYEARVVQVGELQPQWAVVIVDWNARHFIRTGHEGMKSSFDFDGFKSVDDAKANAGQVLAQQDSTLKLEFSKWEKI